MLYFLLLGKNFKPKPKKCIDKKYLKMSVDPLPIFLNPEIEKIYDYKKLISAKNIKPIRRHGGKSVSADVACPYCELPTNIFMTTRAVAVSLSARSAVRFSIRLNPSTMTSFTARFV